MLSSFYMKGSFLFLGSGASLGTPVVGCACAVCRGEDPRQMRLRTSGLLRIGNKQILIDAGPDFRQQCLRHGLNAFDALCLTHAHYDHIGGIEDLRIIYYQRQEKIPCFLSEDTDSILQKKVHIRDYFSFSTFPTSFGTVLFEGIAISYFHYWQKQMQVTGFRVGNFAYVTDISHYDPTIFACLEGIDTLVISACSWRHSAVHLGLQKASIFAQRTGAKRTFFTHISHEINTEKARPFLAPTTDFAYDGLEISLRT
ncbi:MAG: MBL fold metallo-hydrolase [Chlamydiota bacterium]